MRKNTYSEGLCFVLVFLFLATTCLWTGYMVSVSFMWIMGYILLAISIVVLVILILVKLDKLKQEKKLQEAIIKSNISQIDKLSPFMFEEWVGRFLRNMGYKTQVTKRSGDYGIDVIAENEDIRIGIQVKKFSKPVGIKAVQEVISGMTYYNCNEGWVITSTTAFTPAAHSLAAKQNIRLITRNDLALMLSDLQKQNNSK